MNREVALGVHCDSYVKAVSVIKRKINCISKQDRQCTFNVILMRIHLPIVALKSCMYYILLRVYLLPQLSNMQSACAVLYYLWSVWLYRIFLH
jgi:hypothetical protein